jgi:hypothetical protein
VAKITNMKKYILTSLLFFMAAPALGADLIGVWKSNIPVTVSRLDMSEEIKSRIEARLRELGELTLEFTADQLITTRNNVSTTLEYTVKNTQNDCYDINVQGEGVGAGLDVTYCVEGSLLYINFNQFKEYYSRQY